MTLKIIIAIVAIAALVALILLTCIWFMIFKSSSEKAMDDFFGDEDGGHDE